jgi:hypothetical protein
LRYEVSVGQGACESACTTQLEAFARARQSPHLRQSRKHFANFIADSQKQNAQLGLLKHLLKMADLSEEDLS